MKLVTLNLPERYIDGIEMLVRDEIYPNRSEAIRSAIRDFLRREAENGDSKNSQTQIMQKKLTFLQSLTTI